MTDLATFNQYREHLCSIVKKAGDAILDVYQHPDTLEVKKKSDATPVTQADLLSHQIICDGLKALPFNYPILSEEAADIPYSERKKWPHYWLIDPLDGTKEFIERTDDFAMNVALISGDEAVWGIVYVPISGECYFAAKGGGAFKCVAEEAPQPIETTCPLADPHRIVVSRRHSRSRIQQMLSNLPEHELVVRGSALKICLVAEGAADLYPRLGPTSEWDTAAPQIILEEAGGGLTNLAGERMVYNQKDALKNSEFLAFGDPNFDWSCFLP